MPLVALTVAVLLLSSWASDATAAPACPSYQVLAPLSERPTLVRLAVEGDCPAPAQLSARVTRATGASLGVAVVPPDRDGAFAVDLGRWLSPRQRSGVYRIAWQSAAAPPVTVLEHLHTIACPAPPAPVTRFSATESQLTVEVPAGDRCQGETVATLQLGDADGRQIVKPLIQRLPADAGGQLHFDLASIEPRARRTATLVVTNATGETVKTPLQLGEACARGFRVSAELDGDRVRGRIAAEDCHFPVRAQLTLTTERGAVLAGEPVTLRSPTFALELPRSPRAADSGRVDAAFESAASAEATLTLAGSASCPPPSVLDPALERSGDGEEAVVTASYSATLACHGRSKLTLQLRDPQNTVVFNRSLEAAPSPNPIPVRWPVRLRPGVPYELDATIAYGPDRAQTTSGRRRLTAGCPTPGILDLGFSQSDGSALGAHLRLAPCHLPVTATLMIRDANARAVGAFERVVRELTDGPAQPLTLGAVSNLASGRYTASLTLADAHGQSANREATFERDAEAPTVAVRAGGELLSGNTGVAAVELAHLTVEASDTGGLLAPATPLAEQPRALEHTSPRIRIREATAGGSPEVRLVVEYDVAAGEAPSRAVGVLLKSADGRLWRVPAVRRYLVFDPEFLRAAQGAREVAGLLALAQSASLEPGTYRVVGVILERGGADHLVPTRHDLVISPLAHRRALAALRQGVNEIPLRVVFDDTGRGTLSSTTSAAVPEGIYSLQVEVYDRYGNTTGPVVQQLRISPNARLVAGDADHTGALPRQATRATGPTGPRGRARARAAQTSGMATLEIVGSELTLPKPLSLELEWRTPSGEAIAAEPESEPLQVTVVPRPPLVGPTLVAKAAAAAKGRIQITLPTLRPGVYELRLAAPNERAAAAQPPKVTTFIVHDGRPLQATVLALRTRGVAPLTGRLSLEFDAPAARGNLASVRWERSTDGAQYEVFDDDAEGIDFSLETPGSRFYRARLVNRHTGLESATAAVRLTAVAEERLVVEGPDRTFRGFPIELTASGVPAERVRWRVTAPGADAPKEHTGATLALDASATGTFYVEAVALDASGSAEAPAAPRVFRAIEVLWPHLQPSVIAGPGQVEPGRATTFSILHPPLFRGRGNPAIERRGEWELPDGRRVADEEFVEVALDPATADPDGAVIQYHAWIDGARDETLTTAVHRVRLYEYRWPRWALDTQTVSARIPSIYRLAVRPATWEGWLGMPEATLQTSWVLPPDVRVLHRTEREVIIEVSRSEPFDVFATVIDDRGHSAALSATNVSPFRRTELAIETVVTPNRTLHTAPLKVKVAARPVLLPPGGRIERVAYYLNGAQMGSTDGAPLPMELPTAGRYHIRAIASIGTDIVAEHSTLFEVEENAPAVCKIEFLGDFALNGVAKATCNDADGHIVDYRWYRNGELFDTSGPRVKLNAAQLQGLTELSLVATDNAGKEASARIQPPEAEPS